MESAHSLSDAELLARMPVLVSHERVAVADVIEHLIEVDRRGLYLAQACSSLSAYCRERLGYSEDEASKRVRVARFAREVPAVLDELRAGHIHLTGLFVLSQFATASNASELLVEARGKSRRELERALALRFPRADVSQRIVQRAGGSFQSNSATVQPLSRTSFAIQFTASAALHSKLERAKEMLSHSIPNGDLAQVIERALDELIAREERRRLGAGKPRQRRQIKDGSRHVPVAIARIVWERDGGQCTFVGEHGERCSERRFITLEHRFPFALGGTSLDADNLCLLCRAHNHYTARQAYGTEYIARKRSERTRVRMRPPQSPAASPQSEQPEPTPPPSATAVESNPHIDDDGVREQVLAALCRMGFRKHNAQAVLNAIPSGESGAPALLRTALQNLTPDGTRSA